MEKQIWLITGISSGLGKALAAAVIESGDYVIGTFRQQEQVDQFVLNNNGTAEAVVMDVSNQESILINMKRILAKHPKIDVLVNNAGIGFAGAIEETSMAEARRVMEVNFFGALKITQEILPIMRKNNKGHIVQISSHGGIKAFAGFGLYNSSKFALEGFSEALAQEIAPLGIKLTLVEPGPFRTNFAGGRLPLAKNIIKDYNDTAGAFRNKLKGVHQKQEGDPHKAALAIINLVNSKTPCLRLPLGKIALTTIGMKLKSVQSDLDQNRSIAENVVF